MFKKKHVLPIFLQEQIMDCGHVCVAMIAYFFGHQIDVHYLRECLPVHLHGVNLRDLSGLLERLGFSPRALKVSLDELKYVQCPAILHWNMNHFVVLKKVTQHKIIIHDPAIGLRHLNYQAVSQAFTGIVLEIEKAFSFSPIMQSQKIRPFDWLMLIKDRFYILGCLFLLSMVIEILNISQPFFTQYVTDKVIGTQNAENLFVMSAFFLTMICVYAWCVYIKNALATYMKMRLSDQYVFAVMSYLFRLPLRFFEMRERGQLQSKMNGMDDILRKIGTDLIDVVLDGLMLMVYSLILIVYQPTLSMVVFLILGIEVLSRLVFYRKIKEKLDCSIRFHAKASGHFLESLQAILPIKAFAKEQTRLVVWREHRMKALSADAQMERLHQNYDVFKQSFNQIEYIVLLIVGATMILNQTLTIGMLFAFFMFRQQFSQKCTSLLMHWSRWDTTKLQLERMKDIMLESPEISFEKSLKKNFVIHGKIELHNIFFSYERSRGNLLENISLKIDIGEKVVFVGPSGQGKTTLIKLMMGLLKPDDGKILIDGCDLRDIDILNYRSSIASVLQEDTLFNGSILENITFFDPVSDMHKVNEVMTMASIADEIQQFPMGLETRIGDLGSHLSGGQKQRLLLARALYKNPKILFMDEATSHLDTANELALSRALQSLNITQVWIAHRQETIQMADRVIEIN